MPNTVTIPRVRTIVLSSTPTPLSSIAPTDVNTFEVRCVNPTTDWNFRGKDDSVGFPVTAGTIMPIPCSSRR